MTIPTKLLELVERFERNLDAYKRADYKETRVRVEFVDPFFEALGWDVHNVQGYAEQYKDVVHEDAIKVGGATRAPDYCFRVGGARKFFLEVKKPSVRIKEDVGPAYQLRRYAWSAKLPLSILTDFEEFAVYDCRQRPRPTDKVSVGRIMYLTFDQYPDRFGDIYDVFAKEAVLKGSFDRYARDTKRKRGTSEVDAEFLKEIEGWRDVLARNIALRNEALSVHELNFCVQRTVDRLIFLRMCEDRGIEEYGRLLALTAPTQPSPKGGGQGGWSANRTTSRSAATQPSPNGGGQGGGIYTRLTEHYRQAEEKYNSGIFDFQADTLTRTLVVDDNALKPILAGLYYPQSPYEFSVLPPEVLGQVYEQFLGKVIRLTPAHRAKVEEKPAVKKAGGVYYTPAYIVDYIVEQTVGQLIEGQTPRQIGKLRVLDPACGSGSFLLGAYQYLLDYHRRWYEEHDPLEHARRKHPAVYQSSPSPVGGGACPELVEGVGEGGWRLTTAEKKRILLNNIYGVDIDRQAVEVTKLSLLLKVLEGESEESLGQQLTLWRERALPNLGDNIKCGNSLIGPDYFEAQLMPDEKEWRRVNPFDWENEFAEVMAGGGPSAGSGQGFDCVIGNPPYVRQETLGDQKKYFQQNYKVYHGTADLYTYFIERGVSLLKPDGVFCYIVANKWLRANYGKPLRHWMKQRRIEEITDFGDLPVFEKATTYPCILRIRKASPQASFEATQIESLDFTSLEDHVSQRHYTINQAALDDGIWSLADEYTQALLVKLRTVGVPLNKYVDGQIYRGILSGLNKAFVIDAETRARLIAEDLRSTELIKPFLAGRDVKRYQPPSSERYLIFARRGVNIKAYPAIERHLRQFKERLVPKPKGWKGGTWKGRKPGAYQWYEIQDTIDYHAEFEKPKIIYAEIAAVGQFTLDRNNFFGGTTIYMLGSDSKYLLGILNSRLWTFLFSKTSSEIRGGFYRWKYQYMAPLPIRAINFDDPEDAARHDKIVALVERILALHEKLAAATVPPDKELYQRQIEATDRQIDRLVYGLYGLTEEEIEIVEGASG